MTVKYQVVGKGEEILIPGKQMINRKTKLPPGLIKIALIFFMRPEEQ
jgi:hypothetical protein